MHSSTIFLAAASFLGIASAQVLTFSVSTYSGPNCAKATSLYYSNGECYTEPVKAGDSISVWGAESLIGYSGPGCTGDVVVTIDPLKACNNINVNVGSFRNPNPTHI